MFASSAIAIVAFWFMVKTLPGVLQYVGFVFGILSASWLFNEYFRDYFQDDDE